MNSDLFEYISKIIKYIQNKNVIVGKIQIVGSCVRSILRKEKYTDISLVIDNDSLINDIIYGLQVFDKLYEDNEISSFIIPNPDRTSKTCKIIYKNELCTIYMRTKISYFYKINYFMLSCDNLIMDLDGNISTIVPYTKVMNYNALSWTSSCIQDILSNKFRVILLTSMTSDTYDEEFDNIEVYNNISQNMINLGFEFDKENCSNLTSHRFIELISHTDIKKYNDKHEISEKCSICLENYSDNHNKSILLGCCHDFHFVCLKKWLENNDSCPYCRARIEYL